MSIELTDLRLFCFRCKETCKVDSQDLKTCLDWVLKHVAHGGIMIDYNDEYYNDRLEEFDK